MGYIWVRNGLNMVYTYGLVHIWIIWDIYTGYTGYLYGIFIYLYGIYMDFVGQRTYLTLTLALTGTLTLTPVKPFQPDRTGWCETRANRLADASRRLS